MRDDVGRLKTRPAGSISPLMKTLDTLGALIDEHYRLHIYCEATHAGLPCGHHVLADLDAIAARLGRDHSSMHDDLAPKLRCSKCGAKEVSLRLHPPTVRDVHTGEVR